MADFSFLSDSSSDEVAVEDLLNQAMDHSVLEQIARINCSSFSSDSVLPPHLENRFSKLKSFPATNKNSKITDTKFDPQWRVNKIEGKSKPYSHPDDDCENDPVGGNELKPKSIAGSDLPGSKSLVSSPKNEKERGLKKKLGTGSESSLSNSSSSFGGDAVFSPLDENTRKKNGGKSKVGGGYPLSPSKSSDSSWDSPSPPRKAGCFWCSPKKESRRKSKENRGIGGGVDWGGNADELLKDISVFSGKRQKELMKAAMREEERISREAEKVVNWARHGSARINISDVEDELSDSEHFKINK